MRADAVSARSIAASRRAMRGVLGANPIAAVLAMLVPFPGAQPGGRLVVWEQSMYTRCQRQCICLHSSIPAFATQYLGQRHCPIRFSMDAETKRPPISAAFCTVHGVVFAVLFRGLLARRVQRAGVVDLGDLVI